MMDAKNKKILTVVGAVGAVLAVIALVLVTGGKGSLYKGGLDFEMAAPALVGGGGAAVVSLHDLTDVSVLPDTLVANRYAKFTAKFTLGSVLPTDGRIDVDFPREFGLDLDPNSRSGTCSLPGGAELPGGIKVDFDFLTGIEVVVSRKAVFPAPPPLSSGTAIICEFSGIKNPAPLHTGTFTITTRKKDTTKIDQKKDIPGLTIVDAAVLKDVSVVAATPTVNVPSNYTFQFTTSGDLPEDGSILFALPGGINASGAKVKSCNLPGSFTPKFSSNSFRIDRTGGGAMLGGTKVICEFENFLNPSNPGLTSVFGVRTVYRNFNLIDETADIKGVMINPAPAAAGAPAVPPLAPPVSGKLTNATVIFDTLVAGASSAATFDFTYGDPMSNGKIVFYFPKTFGLSKAAWKKCINLAGDLSFSSSVADSTLTISIIGGKTTVAGTAIRCSFDTIINPSAAGPAGDFKVSTFDNFGAVFNQSGPFPVPGLTITAVGAPIVLPGGAVIPPLPGLPGLPGAKPPAAPLPGVPLPGAPLPGVPAPGAKVPPDFDTEVITPPKTTGTPSSSQQPLPPVVAATPVPAPAPTPPPVTPRPPLPPLPPPVEAPPVASPSVAVNTSPRQSPAPAPAAPRVQDVIGSNCAGVNYPKDIENYWASNEIKKAFDLCIFASNRYGRFYPDEPITRFEALKWAMIAAHKVPDYNCHKKSCRPPFTDLKQSEVPWVTAAWKQKILKGFGTRFLGSKVLTRDLGAMLLLKSFNIRPFRGCYTNNCGAGFPNNFFTDITEAWVGPYIRVLWDKKLIAPAGENRFYPSKAITRGEWVYYIMSLR